MKKETDWIQGYLIRTCHHSNKDKTPSLIHSLILLYSLNLNQEASRVPPKTNQPN